MSIATFPVVGSFSSCITATKDGALNLTIAIATSTTLAGGVANKNAMFTFQRYVPDFSASRPPP